MTKIKTPRSELIAAQLQTKLGTWLKEEMSIKEQLIEELQLQVNCKDRESSDLKNFIHINEKEVEENESNGFAVMMGDTAALFKRDPRVGLRMGADHKKWCKKLYKTI